MTPLIRAYPQPVEEPPILGSSNVSTPEIRSAYRRGLIGEEANLTGRERVSSLPEQVGGTQVGDSSSSNRRQASNTEVDAGHERVQERQYSQAFRTLRARQALRQASDSLDEFQRVLGLPESAFWIASFRSALDDLWKVLPSEKAELAHAVAAVQSSIRFNKWSAFRPEQVEILRRCIALIAPLDLKRKDARHVYSVLQSGRLDIFPSAPEKAYELEEADEQEEG